MVHALSESRRVLRVGGRLIDLRPMASGWPVEIVSRENTMHAGRLDDSGRTGLDVTSNQAITDVVQRGWFVKDDEEFFQYAYYWDSIEEMSQYVEMEWSNTAFVPNSVLAEAHRLVSRAGEGVQIRIQRTMLLASYQKLTALE